MLLILYTLQNIHSTWISSNVSAALVLALFHEEAKKKVYFLETYCLPVENYELQESIKFNTRQILKYQKEKKKVSFLFFNKHLHDIVHLHYENSSPEINKRKY